MLYSKTEPLSFRRAGHARILYTEGRTIGLIWIFSCMLSFSNGGRAMPGTFKTCFYPRLLELCDEHPPEEKVILGGDFNTAHNENSTWQTPITRKQGFMLGRAWIDKYWRQFLDCHCSFTRRCYTVGLSTTPREYCWRLDYFLVIELMPKWKRLRSYDVMGSDLAL